MWHETLLPQPWFPWHTLPQGLFFMLWRAGVPHVAPLKAGWERLVPNTKTGDIGGGRWTRNRRGGAKEPETLAASGRRGNQTGKLQSVVTGGVFGTWVSGPKGKSTSDMTVLPSSTTLPQQPWHSPHEFRSLKQYQDSPNAALDHKDQGDDCIPSSHFSRSCLGQGPEIVIEPPPPPLTLSRTHGGTCPSPR